MSHTCTLCAARGLCCDGDCIATLHRSATPKDRGDRPAPPPTATGPRTAQGKAVAARNATTHGLFARDIVLPSLGEDPEGYRQITDELTSQLQPRGLLERHYVEKIAAASWRLRRLHRWQAQIFEDEALTEDERLDRLDKVLRHETALHRQIDTAVKMLNKDVSQLSKGRARDRALLDTMQTEIDCRDSRDAALEVEFEAREHLKKMDAASQTPVDRARLDTAQTDAAQKCQNEPAAARLPSVPAPQDWGGGAESCRNEPPGFGIMGITPTGRLICAAAPPPIPSASPFLPREGGRGVRF
jgi:hypothetical protein